MGPRDRLDVLEKGRSLALTGIRHLDCPAYSIVTAPTTVPIHISLADTPTSQMTCFLSRLPIKMVYFLSLTSVNYYRYHSSVNAVWRLRIQISVTTHVCENIMVQTNQHDLSSLSVTLPFLTPQFSLRLARSQSAIV